MKLYQVYYNEETRSRIHPESIPYDNTLYHGKPLQPAFENHIICDLVEEGAHLHTDYFGVFSWAFEYKLGKNLNRVREQVQGDDIYSFFSKSNQPYIWRQANLWHKGMLEIGQLLMEKMGVKTNLYNLSVRTGERKTCTVYGNYFLAKPEIYERYVNEFLRPAMNIMLGDPEMIAKLSVNSGYKKNRDLSWLVDVTGFPYYPMHTFVCERLFSTWLVLEGKYKVTHI